MIYVAVGTQKFQFNRILEEIDNLVAIGAINEEVFAQVGHSKYCPNNYSFSGFLSKEEFDDCIKRCSLLITHSGVATIMAGIKHNKPVIVVPRLAKYGEHVDDHQVQIAESFSQSNLVLMCGEDSDLKDIINCAREHNFSKYVSQRAIILETIRDYINKCGK